jgi:hypothetical protein
LLLFLSFASSSLLPILPSLLLLLSFG